MNDLLGHSNSPKIKGGYGFVATLFILNFGNYRAAYIYPTSKGLIPLQTPFELTAVPIWSDEISTKTDNDLAQT